MADTLFQQPASARDGINAEAVDEAVLPVKLHNALGRATIRAAYALIEACLNGIAATIVQRNGVLGEKDRELLEEKRGNKFAPVSLRNKLLKYRKRTVMALLD